MKKIPKEILRFIDSVGAFVFGPDHFVGKAAWERELLETARRLRKKYGPKKS